MEKEIWKDVVGYEGLYQVSNLGNVRGLPIVTNFGERKKKHGLRLLKPAESKRGYYIVTLFKDGKGKTIPIHRLIADTFIPNPENKPCVDHINTNKLDNRVENLRWVTYKENANNVLSLRHQSGAIKKRWRNGGFDDRNNLTYRKVAQFTKDGVFIREYESIVEAARALQIDESSIRKVCAGDNPHRHTAGGYKWEYRSKRQKKISLCTK